MLEQLTPAERAVFVLHDVFQFSFERVAEILGRTPAACRQLASRARRHVDAETSPTRFQPESGEHHQIAAAFIAACASGEFERLVELLDPDVVGVVDAGPAASHTSLHGQHRVGRGVLAYFGPRVSATMVSQPINGKPGVLAFVDRRLYAILTMDVRGGLITEIHSIADPAKLQLISDRFALV